MKQQLLKILIGVSVISGSPSFGQGNAGSGDSGSKNKMDIFLLIGQSNMSGRGVATPECAESPAGVFLLDDQDQWVAATHPYNQYSSAEQGSPKNGMNLGYSFARKMKAAAPGHSVGLVVNACGGTSITLWARNSSLFKGAIRRALAAMKTGTLKGILWHQGESDKDDPEYLPKLKQLVADMRGELQMPEVPFIAGEVYQIPLINAQIAKLPNEVPKTGVVSAENLTTQDGVHFDTKSLLVLGERYADALTKFDTEIAAPPDEFVLIPAGTFVMGDQSDPPLGLWSERPAHSVNISAFHMAKYEVTKGLWDTVRIWALNHGYTDLPEGSMLGKTNYGRGPTHPVLAVGWYGMVKWCNARSEKERLTPCYSVSGSVYRTGNIEPDCNWHVDGYRLPTEAEWEKAARGGVTGKIFPWGDTITHSQANYYSVSNFGYDTSPTRGFHPTYNAGQPSTAPVGSFPANGYGLYDMIGNAWEWCWDRYDGSAYPSEPQTDPHGSATRGGHVGRGGNWEYDASYCRISVRYPFLPGPGFHDCYGGFRLARSLVREKARN